MGAKSGKSGKPGQRKKSPPKAADKGRGRQRLALVLFGGLFVALFVVIAVADGIGKPSVPSGDIALIQSAPKNDEGESLGNISEDQYKLAIEQAAGQSGIKKVPKEGSKKYEELSTAAQTELIESVWLRGEAEALGIEVTPKQVETELEQIKESNWPTEAAYKEFLETAHYTAEEVEERVELTVITQEIQQKIAQESAPPTKSEISDYYNSAIATKYTTKPSRDVRLIVNEKKPEVEKALEELEKDNSPANWKKVAKKYSSDPTTSATGGLQKEITEEVLQEPLKKLLFGAATGELLGPTAYQGNFFIFEVVKLNPEKVKTLAEVEQEISSTLSQANQQKALTEFVSAYQSKWRARTFCASGFQENEHCSNQVTSGHPASAPAGCYKPGAKNRELECPAPVEMIKPALPGSTTLLKPEGERLVQRPRPEEKAAGVKEAEIGGAAEGGAEAGAEAGE